MKSSVRKNSVMNWKLNWTLVGIWSQKLPLFVCLFLLSSHHKEITFGWPCDFTTLSYHVINWREIMSWDSWDHLHELTICPLCHFLLGILSWWQMIRNRLVQVGSILSMECKKKLIHKLLCHISFDIKSKRKLTIKLFSILWVPQPYSICSTLSLFTFKTFWFILWDTYTSLAMFF